MEPERQDQIPEEHMQISLSSDEEPVNTSEELAIQEQINGFLLNIRDNNVNISEGQRK